MGAGDFLNLITPLLRGSRAGTPKRDMAVYGASRVGPACRRAVA